MVWFPKPDHFAVEMKDYYNTPKSAFVDLQDTSRGQSAGLADALARLEGQHAAQPGVIENIRNYFRGQRALLSAIGRQIEVTLENPLALVSAAPMVERLRIDRALTTLSSVPEGKILVDTFHASGIPIKINNHPLNANAWLHSSADMKDGRMQSTPVSVTLPAYSTQGSFVVSLAHELQHLNQAVQGVLKVTAEKIVSPLEVVWHNAFVEADAYAASVDIAYKLAKAGQPKAWNSLGDERAVPAVFPRAYEQAIEKDPAAASNGYAKRAAFDAWFEARGPDGVSYAEIYNKQAVHGAYIASVALNDRSLSTPVKHLEVRDLLKIGEASPVNYLALPGCKPLDHASYRSMSYDPMEAGRLAVFHQEYQSKFLGLSPVGAGISAPDMAAPQEQKHAVRIVSNRAPGMKM